jgi:hypothetical protein
MSMKSNGDQELLAPSEKMSWEHLRYPLSDFVLKKTWSCGADCGWTNSGTRSFWVFGLSEYGYLNIMFCTVELLVVFRLIGVVIFLQEWVSCAIVNHSWSTAQL